MRLCSLHLRNLASLAGEWKVDFEDPGFGTGLFAITGPTGSGKTTLLDALCLALYGRTPRLKRVSESENEIMTRGAPDCFAEAVFEAGGERYLARWSQSRTSKSTAQKSFQGAKHLLARRAEGGDYVPIAEKTTAVEAEVKRILKLDFNQFTRTVLLPQGEFASFLRAESSTRAALLEKLTGGEIYREISKRVYERNKEEGNKLASLNDKLDMIKIMDAETRKETEGRIAASRANEEALNASIKQMEEAEKWYGDKHKLDSEKALIARDEAVLEKDKAEAEPEKERLSAAEKAQGAADLHDRLVHDREEKEKAEGRLATLKDTAERSTAENKKAEQDFSVLEQENEKLKKKKEEWEPLWEKARALDIRIKAAVDTLSKAEAKRKTLVTTRDGNLGIVEYARRQADEVEKDRLKTEAALENARKEKEAFEKALNSSDLSKLAKDLEEGKPCPLCGALHHPKPFTGEARGEILDLQKRVELAAKRIDDLEQKRRALEKSAADVSAEKEAASKLAASNSEDLAGIEAECDEGRKAADALKKERTATLGDRNPDTESDSLRKALAASEEKLSAARARKEEAARAESDTSARLESARVQLEALKETLASSEETFLSRINESGFPDEASWEKASMRGEEMDRIRRDLEVLASREEALDRRRAVAEAKDMGEPPPLAEEGLTDALNKSRSDLRTLIQTRGIDIANIAADDENKKRSERLMSAITAQKKACEVWSDLNGLIGMASGDRFSKYVQGVTFRRLISAANKQLENLSDRYRLRIKDDDPLQFDVEDLWQGGDRRTSQNLSGGETFIVSLALALALSHGMKEVHVDSLFLDEGFGTLDEDTLDTVLECLNRLQESGKLVGIISHVASLQERIGCRITLTPAASGHSTLEGPGCSRG